MSGNALAQQKYYHRLQQVIPMGCCYSMFTQFQNEMHTLPFTIETSPVKAGKFYTSRREAFGRGWTESEHVSGRMNAKRITMNLFTSSFNVNRSSQLVNWLGSISAYQTAILRSYFRSMDSVSVPLTLPCNVHFSYCEGASRCCHTHSAARNVCRNGTRIDIRYYGTVFGCWEIQYLIWRVLSEHLYYLLHCGIIKDMSIIRCMKVDCLALSHSNISSISIYTLKVCPNN